MYGAPAGPGLPGITHHYAEVNGTRLHYVAAGTSGSPVLLVHGFPESWWAFRKLIPLLAGSHRVFAVDLRGFGDSGNEPGEYGSTTSAEDLHVLIGRLGVGPVHLTGQDISGATVFRLAVTHPRHVLSLTAIEMGLAGFGLETLADVTHGGSWHIGVLAAPGIPEMLLADREREFLGQFAFPAMSATPGAITDADIDEFARTYSRPGGWRGAAGLYQSMLQEGPDIRALAKTPGQAEAPSRPAPCPRPRGAKSAPCHSTEWATTPPWKPPTNWPRLCSTSPQPSTPPDSAGATEPRPSRASGPV
jgi:pimeloyl-ACP methyl ester carboxylesterase